MFKIYKPIAGIIGLVLAQVAIKVASKQPWYSKTIGGDLFALLMELLLLVLLIGGFVGKSKLRKTWMLHLAMGAIVALATYPISFFVSGLMPTTSGMAQAIDQWVSTLVACNIVFVTIYISLIIFGAVRNRRERARLCKHETTSG